MENNALLNQQQALRSDEILKVTALLYFKDALVAQKYESCKELADAARGLGADSGEITAVIAEYLNAGNASRQKTSRLRSY